MVAGGAQIVVFSTGRAPDGLRHRSGDQLTGNRELSGHERQHGLRREPGDAGAATIERWGKALDMLMEPQRIEDKAEISASTTCPSPGVQFRVGTAEQKRQSRENISRLFFSYFWNCSAEL
jgi:hypothetical protein